MRARTLFTSAVILGLLACESKVPGREPAASTSPPSGAAPASSARRDVGPPAATVTASAIARDDADAGASSAGAAAPSRRGTVAPRVVAGATDRATAAAALKAAKLDDAQVLGQAPLEVTGGLVAVVAPGTLLVREPNGAARTASLGMPVGLEHFEVGFADLDGDGRTDVVLRAARENPPVTLGFLTPAPGGDEAELDDASALAMMNAPSLQVALERAVRVPARGATVAEVCALIGTVKTLAQLRAVVAPDFRVLEWPNAGPGAEAQGPKAGPPGAQFAEGIATMCSEDQRASLACVGGRPFCLAGGSAMGRYVWLTWVNGQLKLHAVGGSSSK